jgi:hypothetical protein
MISFLTSNFINQQVFNSFIIVKYTVVVKCSTSPVSDLPSLHNDTRGYKSSPYSTSCLKRIKSPPMIKCSKISLSIPSTIKQAQLQRKLSSLTASIPFIASSDICGRGTGQWRAYHMPHFGHCALAKRKGKVNSLQQATGHIDTSVRDSRRKQRRPAHKITINN